MATGNLKTYRAKRDFQKTKEPSGDQRVKRAPELRFVVQKHDARRLHYDLRLELGGVFKSWAVTKGPSLNPADKRLAVEVEDHPLDYGDFEGTIPEGEYGGGTVQLWDRGYWRPEPGAPPEEQLAKGDLKFVMEGDRLHGGWVLVRMRNDRQGGKRTNWLLIKHRDPAARPDDADTLLAADKSVASGRSMAQIARGTGKGPAPFMLAAKTRRAPDAVWGSNRGDEATPSSPASRAAPPAASPRKGRAVKTIPLFIEPQLCKLLERPPNTPGWGHEVKFDGYRAQLHVVGHKAVIRTRNGLDWTEHFAAIARDAQALPDCLIDGEIVALDQRELPSFAALQAALSDDNSEDLIFFAFDLLFVEREDLRELPLSERKARLEKILESEGVGKRLRYVAHFESTADSVLDSACKMNLEGIVSKRLDAPYRSGRSGHWTKAKCRAGHEVVLGGWTTEAGQVRSLLAGVNHNGHLVYVGRIGTGFGARAAKALLPRLKALTRDKSPFGGDELPASERKNVRWLEPKLVAEIEFAGWTGAGKVRQAAFKGLREDKPASEVVAERPTAATEVDRTPSDKLAARRGRVSARTPAAKSSRAAAPVKAAPMNKVASGESAFLGVRISKPDKALWPDAGDGQPVTKADLAQYFEAVGEWMLPHLKGRPCSLVRAPDGIGGQLFFQRHSIAGMSEFFSFVKVKGDKAPYVQIDRLEALIAAAQLGALELHPWNCAPGNPEVAGRLVFDLDPAPDVKFDAVVAGALEIRDRLKKAGLNSFCKTTGGKGLHVVTPLAAGRSAVEWPTAKQFAHVVCAQMVQDNPKRYLDSVSKDKRTGKIFLDYLRNDRTATAVAPLSPRARPGATVSMPLAWKDVRAGLDPQRFTVRTAPTLLKRQDAWQGYDEAAKPLADAIKRITASKR
jgi:bifunctional non-homologous end joining protein LigD